MPWKPVFNVSSTFIAASALTTHFWLRNYEPPSSSFAPLIVIALLPSLITVLMTLHSPDTFLTTIISVYAKFYAFLAISVATYRLSPVHPLAKYPGPIVARVSKLWVVWKALDGKIPQYYQKLHDRYGPIVRIGPNEISVADKNLIMDIAGTHGMPKGPMWDGRRVAPGKSNPEPNLIQTRSLARHAQLRKAWNKAFSTEALADYKEILLQRVDVLQTRLRAACQEAEEKGQKPKVDLSMWINYFSFDLMNDLAFGGGSEMLQEGDKYHYLEKMENGVVFLALAGLIPWITQPALILFPALTASTRQIARFAAERARSRLSKLLPRKDLFYHIVNNNQQGSEDLSFPLIVSNAVLAIFAGSDTTSSALTNVIYYLLSNPEYLVNLRRELEQELIHPHGRMNAADLEQLASLPWLNAIINEALRLQPILPTGLQRAPEKGSGGKKIGSHFIQEGNAVQVPLYVIQRDPKYFSPNPERFWPERWIQHRDNPQIVHTPDAFMPFSTGPAGCVGKPFALMELRYVIVSLVNTFDMKFEDCWNAREWEKNLKDRFMLTKGKLMVELALRAKD